MTQTSELATFTLAELAREVMRLATENPDFVYESPDKEDSACFYLPVGETPGCIFGQALTRLGVSQEFLAKADDRTNQFLGTSITGILNKIGFSSESPDSNLLEAFRKVQTAQDARKPWGEAVKPLKELGY